MGTVPIVIFRGLGQSRAQGLGELGTPHFPGYTPAWYNPKLNHLYTGYCTVQYCTVLMYSTVLYVRLTIKYSTVKQ